MLNRIIYLVLGLFAIFSISLRAESETGLKVGVESLTNSMLNISFCVDSNKHANYKIESPIFIMGSTFNTEVELVLGQSKVTNEYIRYEILYSKRALTDAKDFFVKFSFSPLNEKMKGYSYYYTGKDLNSKVEHSTHREPFEKLNIISTTRVGKESFNVIM
jgi:hypothetical protein